MSYFDKYTKLLRAYPWHAGAIAVGGYLLLRSSRGKKIGTSGFEGVIGGFAVAGDGPQRTAAPPEDMPEPGTGSKAGVETVLFEAVVMFDQRPEPGEYATHNSVVTMPDFMGGGSTPVPFTLGYPRNWIAAGRQTATLAEFGFVPDLRVWIEGDAAHGLEEALQGKDVWIPCHRWVWTGKTADGPLVWDANGSGELPDSDVLKGENSRCRFQIPVERPRVGIAREGDVYRLLFSPKPGEGGIARYRVIVEVVKP